MSFKNSDEGFECETVQKKQSYIHKDCIVKIFGYTQDLGTYDELRLGIETTHGVSYHFSEEESDWKELLNWVKDFASLESDWMSKAYPEPFSREIKTLWDINT
jgi:hypothetical protein